MHRSHIDDLQHMMPHSQFAFMRLWIEKHGAVIVQPDPVRIPNNHAPGTYTMRAGRFGQDEPYPPYSGTRKLLEDAHRQIGRAQRSLGKVGIASVMREAEVRDLTLSDIRCPSM